MKRMRWAFLAGSLVILIARFLVWPAGPKEPSYHGRILSSWLEEWDNSYYDRTNPASIAIRAIGSNGVPILLARLSKEQSPNERKFWRYARKIVPNQLADDLNPITRTVMRAVGAAEAINLLGAEAKSAFPTLTNLLSNQTHCLPAAIGLAGMGHEGVDVLLQALTNQDWIIRYSAASALGEARSDLDKVVPALIDAVKIEGRKKEDEFLRGEAGSALVQLHKEPDLVVPVFSEFLTSPDPKMRIFGASLLGGFGTDAKAAVPQLLKARIDADPDVRETAESALKEIDPKALANVGLK